MNPKVCILCKHFYFDPESPGYSEYTPGSDVTMGCYKNVWAFERTETSEEYRLKMASAETCKLFEHYKSPEWWSELIVRLKGANPK